MTSGFTLIEIIVVISLISMTLFLAIPRFQQSLAFDDMDESLRWLITNAGALRQKAVQDQIDYTLHIDMDAGKVWISAASMTDQQILTAMEEAVGFPNNVRVVDVEFPNIGKASSGTVDILFYKGGYSDKVLLHIETAGRDQTTLLIEPFLTQIQSYDTFIEFEG